MSSPRPPLPLPPGNGSLSSWAWSPAATLCLVAEQSPRRRCRLSSGVPSLCLLINSLGLLFPGTSRAPPPRRPDPGPLSVASRAPSPGGISALRVFAAATSVRDPAGPGAQRRSLLGKPGPWSPTAAFLLGVAASGLAVLCFRD